MSEIALPSSPPLLPEQDLPTSPTFPPLASTSSSNAGLFAHHRKRQLSDYESMSSDPIFSDATSDSDANHYEADQPRRKKLVRGPWWNLRRDSSQDLRRSMAKRENSRNVDSGVWLGSDSSDGGEEFMLLQRRAVRELTLEEFQAPDHCESIQEDREALAARYIHYCVDNGKESVDLTNYKLGSISDVTLASLHQLIRQTFADHTHPPSEDEFSPLTPSIQLFLAGNHLTSLPAELFNLTNISVLSLRNNELASLPPAISRLKNLEELNIAGNRILHLPWEMLDQLDCQGDSRRITLRPNPLVEPCDLSGPSPLPRARVQQMLKSGDLSLWGDTGDAIDQLREKYKREEGSVSMRAELELRLKLGRMLRIQYMQESSRAGKELKVSREELIYLASSAVRYFDADGTPVRRLGALQAETDDAYEAVLDPTANAPSSPSSASAPSLFELALRSTQANYNLHDFITQPNNDLNLSSTLISALRRAATNTATHGNETCSTCDKQFIIPRAEWMEYWFHGFSSQQELTPETVLPFLRKACSWGCAAPSELGAFRC